MGTLYQNMATISDYCTNEIHVSLLKHLDVFLSTVYTKHKRKMTLSNIKTDTVVKPATYHFNLKKIITMKVTLSLTFLNSYMFDYTCIQSNLLLLVKDTHGILK